MTKLSVATRTIRLLFYIPGIYRFLFPQRNSTVFPETCAELPSEIAKFGLVFALK
jgi:hypothetical protein